MNTQGESAMRPESNIVKAIKLLDFFTSDRPHIGLNELCRLANLPKTTIYRQISALEDAGLVSRCREYDTDRRYKLGIKLFELGMRFQESFELAKVALPLMKDLKAEIGEAVHLVIRDGNEAVYLEKIEADHPVRLYTAKGRRAPLYAGASCQVLLAFMPAGDIQRILEQPLKKYTEHTPDCKEAVLEKLEFIRINKYAISKEELCLHSMEIAVPIYDISGQVIASLSTAALVVEMDDIRINKCLQKLREYSSLISSEIGGVSAF